MAVIAYTIDSDETFGNDIRVVSWRGLAKGDSGRPFQMPGWADRSVQIGGDFDLASITIEGSNDGVDYIPLSDPQGSAIAMTTAGLVAIVECVCWIRPNIGGTGGATNANVTLLVRRQ